MTGIAMDSWIIESGCHCPVVRLGRRRSRRGPKEVAGPRGNVVPRNSVGTPSPQSIHFGKDCKICKLPEVLWHVVAYFYNNTQIHGFMMLVDPALMIFWADTWSDDLTSCIVYSYLTFHEDTTNQWENFQVQSQFGSSLFSWCSLGKHLAHEGKKHCYTTISLMVTYF